MYKKCIQLEIINVVLQILYRKTQMLKLIKDFYKKHDLRPVNSTWLCYIHLLGVLGLCYLFYRTDIIFQVLLAFFALANIYGLGVTAGSHRLWAHKTYHASLPLRIFLMLLNSGMFQGPIFSWSRDHRLHHKFSDTKLDPHDISKGFFYAHVGWLLKNKSPELYEQGQKLDLDDLKKDSVVMFQRNHFLPLAFLMTFAVPALVFSYWVPVIPAILIAALLNCYTLNATWCVNSICHMFGSRKWNPNIEPRDNYFVSLVAVGEGYHNWHHEYPSDWRGSKNEWYMFNFTTYFLELMFMLGLAKELKK